MKKQNKNQILTRVDGKHSFLVWLIIPIVLVWLSVGYLVGLATDTPLWAGNKQGSQSANQIVPYFKDYGSFSENLDQPFVSMWFDDAWDSQYLKAYPILKKDGFPGAIAVPVNAVETVNYMNWAQLEVLQKNGWEIADHSLVHDCAMQKWSREKIVFEFKNSKFILWKNGLSADIFVTPCGVDSAVMRQEASKIFMGYRTVDPGYNDPSNFNVYNLKVQNIDDKTTLAQVKSWIDKAKSEKQWVILVFHKVGESTGVPVADEFNTSVKEFQGIVDYVKESGIKVVTPSQIIASQTLNEKE